MKSGARVQIFNTGDSSGSQRVELRREMGVYGIDLLCGMA